MDTLTHFFANHVFLSFLIVGFVLFMMIPGKGGGGFLGSGLVKIIVLAVIVIILVPSCIQALNQRWDNWKANVVQDAPGFVQWGLCNIFGLDAACTIYQMSQAPAAATDRRVQCIEQKIAENSVAAAPAQRACGLRGDPPDEWESCIEREFDKVPSLQGVLIECQSYSPSQWGKFWADVIEPFACPLGIKSWCQTGSGTAPQQPYVYDRGWLACLRGAADADGLDQSACVNLKDAQAWDACMVSVIKSNPDQQRASQWLAYCQTQRSQPSGT